MNPNFGHQARWRPALLASLLSLIVSQFAGLRTIAATERAPSTHAIAIMETNDAVECQLDGETLWRYFFTTNKSKPGFYPLRVAGGESLAALQPSDHVWHYGLWFSWKYINGVNYWEERNGHPEGVTKWEKPKITAHKDGSAEIKMNLSYVSPANEVMMTEKRDIKISRPGPDGGVTIDWTGKFTAGSQEDLSLLATWGSSDEAITTVSPFGFTSASGPGQTSISASFLNPVTGNPVAGAGSVVVNPGALARIDICAATVSNAIANCPPLDPSPLPPGISFANQTQFALVAIGTFTDGSRQDLTDAVRWTSDNPGAAAVSNDPGIPGITTGVGRRGIMTGGIQGGTAVITAASGGISGSATVSVTFATPQSLAITPANGIVALGIPQQCKVTGSFNDGSKQDVTATVEWSSLNPDIAIVYPGGLAYTTGKGIANPSQDPSRLVVNSGQVMLTMVNPSTTNVFPWPIGSAFQLHGLTVSSGDVSLLNDTPFTILSESDPADSQHIQPCKPGQNCDIRFAPAALQPADGTYTLTSGTGQASALIQATMNVIVNSTVTQVSGSTTLTVQ